MRGRLPNDDEGEAAGGGGHVKVIYYATKPAYLVITKWTDGNTESLSGYPNGKWNGEKMGERLKNKKNRVVYFTDCDTTE